MVSCFLLPKKEHMLTQAALLEEFTIIADDSPTGLDKLPYRVKNALLSEENHIIVSPDSYKFVVKPYSAYRFAK